MLLIFILMVVIIYLFKISTKGICRSPGCLLGKTAIITGANSGIGYQTALNLASRGCKIIMADWVDMEASKQKIIKHTNNNNIYAMKLDLTSQQSIKNFVAEVIATNDKLDILVNNAGIGLQFSTTSQPNLNSIMQVNYFGHLLLTLLLLDLMKTSAPSRIVFTSSAFAYLHNLTPDSLGFAGSKAVTASLQTYCNSKLAVLIASDIFSEKLKGTGVTSNAVHPGYVATGIFSPLHNLGFVAKIFLKTLEFIFAKDPWEGSQTLVDAVVSNELEEVSGKFLCDCRPFWKPLVAYDREYCQQIWRASLKHIGLEELTENI